MYKSYFLLKTISTLSRFLHMPLPPILDSIVLQFLKSPHTPQGYTVCMTTHTCAKDLRKDDCVAGVEVSSMSWHEASAPLKLIFEEAPIPSLSLGSFNDLNNRTVSIYSTVSIFIDPACKQLCFRPLRHDSEKLEVRALVDGRVLNTRTIERGGVVYILPAPQV